MTAFAVTYEPKFWQEPPLREIHLMETRAAINQAVANPIRAAILDDPEPPIRLIEANIPYNIRSAALSALLSHEVKTLT